MLSDDIAFTPATELRRLIGAKQVSPVELVDLYLRRIERLDGTLHSYLTVAADQAFEAAKAAEAAVSQGGALGPLHGVPISIKDLEPTRGIRTTGGSLVFEHRIPDRDSIVVERVRASGAIILGKTNKPEFGLLGTTENRLGEGCRNPWDPERTSGGSSGGAASALAAGLCALATGTDGGGSIRIPASFCGVYGIKPQLGRVPRGPLPASAPGNQLSHPGPIARTVADAALLLSILAGYDRRDPASLRDGPADYVDATSRDIKGLRMGWSADFGYAPVDPEVQRICRDAAGRFQDLGCPLADSELALDEPYPAFWTLFATNSYATFSDIWPAHAEEMTSYAQASFGHGASVTGTEYARALGYRDRLRGQFDDIFDRFDVLLSPTVAVPAFPVRERPDTIAGKAVNPFWGFLPFTFPINMVGLPAASIPCGLSEAGLPIGLHIVGRRGDEETVLAVSAAFERTGVWSSQPPTIS